MQLSHKTRFIGRKTFSRLISKVHVHAKLLNILDMWMAGLKFK